jgi:Domain of unknown function (DUF5666)
MVAQMKTRVQTIHTTRYLWLGIVGLLVLFAVLLLRPGGIGGTGIGDGEGNGGIGGTGIGVGIGTGFVGRIDRFGSIWVNGAEIFYDEDIHVNFNGRVGVPSDLKIGHVVQLIAKPDNEGVLHATSLDVRYEVIGEVKALNQNTATIFTDTVEFSRLSAEGAAHLALGDKVAVSGFRRGDGVIMASQIDMITDDRPSQKLEATQSFAQQMADKQVGNLSLSGYMRPETNGYSLYGYQIETLPDTVLPSDFVTVAAKINTDTIKEMTISKTVVPIQDAPPETAPDKKMQPRTPPQEVPTPVPAPQQKRLEGPNKMPPIKPQPISKDIPKIEKPVRPDLLIVPSIRPNIQGRDIQGPNIQGRDIGQQEDAPTPRPLDEPQNQLPASQLPEDQVPQQREMEEISARDKAPDEEVVDQVSDTKEREPSPDEPDMAEPGLIEPDITEQAEETRIETVEELPAETPAEPPAEIPEEIDAPEREVVSPERDVRPETLTRPERVERPDRPERPERVERPARPERPERPERPDRPR